MSGNTAFRDGRKRVWSQREMKVATWLNEHGIVNLCAVEVFFQLSGVKFQLFVVTLLAK